MTRLILMSILVSAALAAPELAAAPAAAADPTGVWRRGDGNADVRIAPCGPDLCATNTRIGDPGSGEAVGDRLIMKLAPRTANELAGTAYDPKRDRTYSVTVTVGTDGMTTRGCVFYGLLCRSVTWARLSGS
jgi:uncharacterized protein (DUF2147 family)